VFKPDDKQHCGHQQQQRQAGESPKGSDKKHNFLPSISQSAENTTSYCNNSGTGNALLRKSNKSSSAVMPIYHQRDSFQWKPSKAEGETCNAPSAAVETTKHTFEPNTACQTHLIIFPEIAVAMTANKLNAKSYLTRSSKKYSLPLSIPTCMGEVWWYWVKISELGKPSHICELGWDTTAPDCLEIQSHSRRSGCDVKLIPMGHRVTGFHR